MKDTILVKLFLITAIAFALLIPMGKVQDLIRERQVRSVDVSHEIQEKWAKEQTLVGPILKVDFKTPEAEFSHFYMPQTLNVTAKAKSETLNRGIFKVPAYQSQIHFNASFDHEKMYQEINEGKEITHAEILIWASDLNGLQESVEIHSSTGNQKMKVSPWLNIKNKPVLVAKINPLEDLRDVQIQMNLKGTRELKWVPSGIETTITLESNWQDPKFDGYCLPIDRTISETGFHAHWKAFSFQSGLPTSWTDSGFPLDRLMASSLGVEFMVPVDIYQQSTRAAKYALLFIILTFSLFFLFELLFKLRIHPIQYLLVGCALCLFFLILFSLSEHLPFWLSYGCGAIANLGLISFYSASVFKQKKRITILTGLLILMFSYLFMVLRLETFALLFGSILLFLTLAALMISTRKLDWYDLAKPLRPRVRNPKISGSDLVN